MVVTKTESGKITAVLTGEIDHHSARIIRTNIDRDIQCQKPKTLILDFSGVDFMDSSGIGLIMGRYKMMLENDGQVIIRNPKPYVKKVLNLAGITRIVKLEEQK